MGKPADLAPPSYKDDSSQPTTPLGEGASSISMHHHHTNHPGSPSRQQRPYFDHDDDDELLPHADDDLPPLYSDSYAADAAAAAVPPSANPLIPAGTPRLDITPFRSSDSSGTTYFVDRRLDTDPAFLQAQLAILAESPPRPFCHLRGTHTETRRDSDREERRETVVDFDVEVELTAVLYTDARTGSSWRKLTTVGNFEKARRGTVLAKRAPGSSGQAVAESGTPPPPTVQEWCHRYCASSAGLKTFTLERRVTGWDFAHLERKLTRLIRNDTNYQGHLRVTFPVHNSKVEIHNDCRASRWRLTRWIRVLCYATLTFLLAWPWLVLRTKRWETVYVEWPLREARTGRYASVSEDEWFNMWARAIQTACLARRRGALDQGDLDQGQAGGLVQAMGVVNTRFGWGGDDDDGRRRGGLQRRSGLPTLGRR